MSAGDEPRRVLIIRPSALGDVARSVPLAASIKRRYPAAQIHWLVNRPFVDIVRSHPAVDRVVPFDRGTMGRSLLRGRPGEFLSFVKSLRSEGYDTVLDAQGLGRSGLFSRLSGAHRRIGHADAREFAPITYTDRVPAPESPHTVDRMLSLLGPLGIEPVADMSLTPPPEAVERIAAHDVTGSNPIVLAPTSIWPGKQWPIDRFVELAARLSAAGHGLIVAVGGPNEREQCAGLLARPGIVDMVGRTSVGELMALIQRARLVVANDSAALHIAVGFDRPIVALFGPTRTELVGPYRRERDVIQHVLASDRMDHKDAQAGLGLMSRIGVDEVSDACLERLR